MLAFSDLDRYFLKLHFQMKFAKSDTRLFIE